VLQDSRRHRIMSHIASVIKSSCAAHTQTRTHTHTHIYVYKDIPSQDASVCDRRERTTLRATQQASRAAHFRFR